MNNQLKSGLRKSDKKVNVKLLKTKIMKTETNIKELVNNNQPKQRKFKIGDKVYLKDGIGKGSIGYVYDYVDFKFVTFYKCFFKDFKVVLKGNLNNEVSLQGGYTKDLLILLEDKDKSIEELVKQGLELDRKNFNISTNRNYSTNPKLLMSYDD